MLAFTFNYMIHPEVSFCVVWGRESWGVMETPPNWFSVLTAVVVTQPCAFVKTHISVQERGSPVLYISYTFVNLTSSHHGLSRKYKLEPQGEDTDVPQDIGANTAAISLYFLLGDPLLLHSQPTQFRD